MLCHKCKKRDVEVLIRQVINHEVQNLNLCRVCAEEMGFISPDMPSITISFSLNDKDARMFGKGGNVGVKEHEHKERQHDECVCDSCGMKYEQFKETGLLGCPACYVSFRFPLGVYLQKEQGAESHWGGDSEMFADLKVLADENPFSKEYVKSERDARLVRLKAELSDAVLCEEYERAAGLRDAILEMQSGGKKIK